MSPKRALSSADDMLIAFALICILIGILLIAVGVVQCRQRITDEDLYISADAEIVRIDSRIRVVLVNHLPIITREYRPVIAFIAENGESITSEGMPWAIKADPECAELMRMFDTNTPITVRYDPKKPTEIYYRSRKSFRYRELVYKIIAASVLFGLGLFCLWGNTMV